MEKTGIRRGTYRGPQKGDPPKEEAANFYRCELCGAWVDRRDTCQVYDHARALPHLTEGREN
jgi:hypothetical protein